MTADTLSADVAKRARPSVFTGVFTAAVGVVMIIHPIATAAVDTVFLGWALIMAAAQFAFAFTSETADNLLKRLLGVAYSIVGIDLVFFPLADVATLTRMLGVMLVAQAILETVVAIALPPGTSRGWFLCNGLASLLLGVLILAHWASSSAWAIGTLVGTAVFINGITRIAISSRVSREIRPLQHAA
jgi:uncharacterized membrane protein HdeD (DUF308 family)